MLRNVLEWIAGIIGAFLFFAMFWIAFFFDSLDQVRGLFNA